MKKILLAAVLFAAFNTSFAQSNNSTTKDSLLKSFNQLHGHKLGVPGNSLGYKYLNSALQPIIPIDSANSSQGIYMPNAFKQKLQLTLLENNGNGFLLYKSTPDNMYVLKPDSTFYSAMPVR